MADIAAPASNTGRGRVARGVRVLASLGAATALVALPVVVATPAHAAAPTGTAVIRGAHLSPNTPGVDVYLTGFNGSHAKLWLTNLGYGDFSAYRRIAAGVYAVAMRAHGAPASSPAALTWTINARAGHAYTVAAVGMNKNLRGVVLPDDLQPAASGHGRVRVIQAASRAPQANVTAVPHTVVAKNASFASATNYTSVPAGTWTVRAADVDSTKLTTSSAVHIRSGSVNSIVLLDSRTGGITLRSVEDAAGSPVSPKGSIDAGGGGTAIATAHFIGSPIPLLLVVVVVVGLGAVAMRRYPRPTR